MQVSRLVFALMLLGASCAYAAPDHGVASVAADVVHLNQANEQQLASLKGVGQKRAAAIVAYRQSHGKFQTITDMASVPGISKKVLDKISQQNPQRLAL